MPAATNSARRQSVASAPSGLAPDDSLNRKIRACLRDRIIDAPPDVIVYLPLNVLDRIDVNRKCHQLVSDGVKNPILNRIRNEGSQERDNGLRRGAIQIDPQ